MNPTPAGRGALHDALRPLPPDGDPMAERVRGSWADAESSDENSAPDFDLLTFIEPSIYKLPQARRRNSI